MLFNSIGQIFKHGSIFFNHFAIWVFNEAAHSTVIFATVGLQTIDNLLGQLKSDRWKDFKTFRFKNF